MSLRFPCTVDARKGNTKYNKGPRVVYGHCHAGSTIHRLGASCFNVLRVMAPDKSITSVIAIAGQEVRAVGYVAQSATRHEPACHFPRLVPNTVQHFHDHDTTQLN